MKSFPVADESIKGRQGFGLIQIFTGNGKGKTTAATGEMIRALGAGKKVGIVYFDKGGESHYFERTILRNLGVDLVATGRDRIDPITNRFDFSISEIDKTEAARGLIEVQRMFDAGYDLVVLDEINSTADLGMISVESVLNLLDKKPEQTELVLTGRNAPQAFLDKAHLLTEMCLHKHYFYSGVKAREGLDY
jgi:cob(I)alamin adenosyltransferase